MNSDINDHIGLRQLMNKLALCLEGRVLIPARLSVIERLLLGAHEIIDKTSRMPTPRLVPCGYASPRHWWRYAVVTLASFSARGQSYPALKDALINMRKHDCPTYCLRPNLVDALLRTDISRVDLQSIKWAHPSLMLCLPSNHPDLRFMSLHNESNTTYETNIETVTITVDGDRVVITMLSAHSEVFTMWGDRKLNIGDWFEKVMVGKIIGTNPTKSENAMVLCAGRIAISLLLAWQSTRSNGDKPILVGCNWTKSEGGEPSKHRPSAILVDVAPQRKGDSESASLRMSKNILHWTRGHFRQQPYGDGRTLTKTIWIEPYHSGSLTLNV